jgi:hypothetical protein
MESVRLEANCRVKSRCFRLGPKKNCESKKEAQGFGEKKTISSQPVQKVAGFRFKRDEKIALDPEAQKGGSREDS